MPRLYEITLIYDPDLSEEELESELKKVEQVFAAHSGTVEKKDLWGRRELAYPMNKKDYGIYVLLVVSGGPTLVSEFKRVARINDRVLRAMVVNKDQYAPDFCPEVREESPRRSTSDSSGETTASSGASSSSSSASTGSEAPAADKSSSSAVVATTPVEEAASEEKPAAAQPTVG